MRVSIIRLIWLRELRDLLRDRRTVFMLVVLPVLLYPMFIFGGFVFALTTLEQVSRVGVFGAPYLPPPSGAGGPAAPSPAVAWLALTPGSASPAAVAGAAGLFDQARRQVDYPPLIVGDRFAESLLDPPSEARTLRVVHLNSDDRSFLDTRTVDAMLVVPADFREQLARERQPAVKVLTRDGDEASKLAGRRVNNVLNRYRRQLRETRFLRRGLPADFEKVLVIEDSQESKPLVERTLAELRDQLAKFMPFILVMWALAGSLHPAIDLCAGEKERGTMETLLISPVTRGEIVWGKFLAIWAFSTGATWWNLVMLGGGTLLGGWLLRIELLTAGNLAWCLFFTLPVTALFSSYCLGLGAYARSTKEGQYYLLPLFLFGLGLISFSLAPGVELNYALSLIPITGLSLLLQRLLSVSRDPVPWPYFIPVFLSMAAFINLGLRWSLAQFRRESVLFRDAERPDPLASLISKLRQGNGHKKA